MNTKALNRIYRLIWSEVQQGWIAVAETTRGRGKQSSSLTSAALSVTAASLLLFGPLSYAAPTGGQVVSGSASIAESGSAGQSTTTITQYSDKLSLSWKTFNVGKAETVNFVQRNASALAVNRIYDTQGSEILGRINADGQVWLINPNGVLFGQGAQINVGALVASTLDTSDANLGQSGQRFSGNSTASVTNLGQINAAQGGYVALLGHSVINQGGLSAPGGTVAMGAGSAVSLNFAGSKLLGLQVEQHQLKALAENGGLIQADGGQVLLSAGARDSLLASVVNNTGIIQARTVQEQGGKIILLGGMAAGTTHVGGTLDASAPNGSDGGFIETSAHTVHVADSARITTASAKGKQGQWLIDPYDFVVAASGGNITGAALGAALNANSVTIQTTDTGTSYAGTTTTGGTSGNGDIFVNDAVTWDKDTTLTLDAWRNININATITANHDNGKLALMYGQGKATGYFTNENATYNIKAPVNLKAGNNFSTKLGSSGSTTYYTVITSLGLVDDGYDADSNLNSLQGLAHSSRMKGNWVLGANIDASETVEWDEGLGFSPIGSSGSRFTGAFDGLGHTIKGLVINRPGTDYVGLFGTTGPNSIIRNVGLVDVSVSGKNNVGGLVGMGEGSISGSYVTGNVKGFDSVGGLIGFAKGEVLGSYALSDVAGVTNVGGLVGRNYSSAVFNSYASGSVRGITNVGGLMGSNVYGHAEKSYASGSASGITNVGGLIGFNENSVFESYAIGRVSGTTNVGGLMGSSAYQATFKRSYFNTASTGQEKGVGLGSDTGVTGLSTDEMQQSGNFSGFDFGKTWFSYDGHTSPLLRNFLTTLTVTVKASGSKTYDGTTACTSGLGCEASYFDSLGKVFGEAVYALDSKNTGSRSATASGLYSDQQGYLIKYVQGSTATISKADLTVTATQVSKTYDGTTNATGSATVGELAGKNAGESVKTDATLAFTDKNAGTGNKTVRASDLAIKDSDNADVTGNYNISYVDNATSTIEKADLTVSGTAAAGKTYDGNTSAAITVGTLSGFVGKETVSASASGTFDSKDPGVRSATAKYTLADNAATGGQAANYQLADTTGLSATIEKAPVQKAAAEDATTGVDIKNTASWVDSQNKQSQQLRQAQFITATVAPVQITQPVLVRSTGVLVPDGAYQKESAALVPLDIPLTALMLPSLRKLAPDAADKREP